MSGGETHEPITREQVLDILKNVSGPGGRDLVSAGAVARVVARNGQVTVSLQLPGPAEVNAVFKDAVRDALADAPGLTRLQVVETVAAPRRDTEPEAAHGHEGHGHGHGHQTAGAKADIPGIKHIVAVASGKGGVGKSTVAVNLACALTRRGLRTGLMDSDVYGPSVPLMMGIEAEPQVSPDKKILPLESHGVKLMSLGFLLGADDAVIWRGPMVMQVVRQFLRDVAWGELDVLVVDLPPGTGDAQLTLVQQVPLAGGVIVTTPQAVALLDVRRGIQMFRKVDVPILGVVENMSYFVCPDCKTEHDIFDRGGGQRAARDFGVPFLGDIPIHPTIRACGDEGRPIVVAEPDSPITAAFLEIADQLLETLEPARAGSS